MQNCITLGQPLLGEKYVAQKEKKRKKKNTARAEGGSSLTGLRTLDPPLGPPSTLAEFSLLLSVPHTFLPEGVVLGF